MISMWGISRRPRRIDSKSFGASVRPSPPRDQHVADLRGPAEVVELGLVLLAVEVLGRVADDPRPRAVAAVARALGRDEHQDPVRVAMHEAGHRGVAVLGERVLHHRGEGLLLAPERDDLAADRVVGSSGSIRLMKYGVMSTRNLSGAREAGPLLVGEVEDRLDLLEVVDAVAQLPAPVVPLLVGNVVPERRAAADGGLAIRAERLGRVAAVDERLLGGGAMAASWWATASLISWASKPVRPPWRWRPIDA